MTALNKAISLIDRWTTVAKKDGTPAGGYGIKVTPAGRYYTPDNQRIGYDAACAIVAHAVNEKARPVTGAAQPTSSWDKLNDATQSLFFRLCEEILTATQDASLIIAARLGRDIPKITLQDAPRLTNLKKAGLLCTKPGQVRSHKMLEVTPEGRDLFFSHT